MSDDYGFSDKRSKKRDKFKKKKLFPYKHGGAFRVSGDKAVIKD
jgi:hypothetical protein